MTGSARAGGFVHKARQTMWGRAGDWDYGRKRLKSVLTSKTWNHENNLEKKGGKVKRVQRKRDEVTDSPPLEIAKKRGRTGECFILPERRQLTWGCTGGGRSSLGS